MYALRLAPAVTTGGAPCFSPVPASLKFLYPSRAPRFGTSSIVLGAVWAMVMLYVIWTLPDTSQLLIWASLAYPAYYCGMSFWLQATERR